MYKLIVLVQNHLIHILLPWPLKYTPYSYSFRTDHIPPYYTNGLVLLHSFYN